MRPRIGVVYGGQSAEHEISVRSAKTVLAHFPGKYQPVPIYITRSGRWKVQRRVGGMGRPVDLTTEKGKNLIKGLRLHAVIPVLHGPNGEDGTIQGLFELAGVPYAGCGVLASAAGMDKEVTKILAAHAGLPQVKSAVLRRADAPKTPAAAKKAFARFGLPLFVKPARMGSSVGVSKVKAWSDWPKAAREALRFDHKIIVEKGVDAREVEVAVLGDEEACEASVAGEIVLHAEWYDYATKYQSKTASEQVIPARISKAQMKTVRELAKRAFLALGGEGLARVDFLLERKTGKFYFNELNTLPGFTSISMYPMMMEASGKPIPKVLERLINLGVKRAERRAKLSLMR